MDKPRLVPDISRINITAKVLSDFWDGFLTLKVIVWFSDT